MKTKLISALMSVGLAALAAGCDNGDSNSGSSSGGTGGSTAMTGSGGSGNTGGSAPTGTGAELLTDEAKMNGWIGGDTASSADDPGGIQGSVYLYGDGTSCTAAMGNPCTVEKGCCISGHTVVDSTYKAWGCGIGIGLNETGGDASVKQPYKGAPGAKFSFTITGTTGGNPLRVGFTQAANTTDLVSPYKQLSAFTAGTTATMGFSDATFPTWCKETCVGSDGAVATPGSPANPAGSYDIQFQIPGGDKEGDFNFCITSITVQ
jgi:hypothetical protein